MPWIQLKINSTAKQADDISDLLMENGAVAITLQDRYDNPVFEPLPDEVRLWGDTDVIALLDAATDIPSLIAILQSSPRSGTDFCWQIEQVEEREWQRAWMENFHPLRFGQRLWICPSWRPVPDPGAVNVMLDPGLAFGTGSHPTTALCLEWLDSLDLRGKSVIDFGCGSGILAIAALKLGAVQAVGIDIDPQALQASRDNAQRNGVAEQLALYHPHQSPANLNADVVIANILAGPLRELAPQVSALVRPGGYLGLSGILTHQAEQVIAAYQIAFRFDPVAERDEWCRLTGVQHPFSSFS